MVWQEASCHAESTWVGSLKHHLVEVNQRWWGYLRYSDRGAGVSGWPTCYSHHGLDGNPSFLALHPIPALMSKSHKVIRSLSWWVVADSFHFLLSIAVAGRVGEGGILLFGTFRKYSSNIKKMNMEHLICTFKLCIHQSSSKMPFEIFKKFL